MNVLVAAHRTDETVFFEQANKAFGFRLHYSPAVLTLENAAMTKGFDAVSINAGSRIDGRMARTLAANGVKWLATRSAGKDHIDPAALAASGLKAANVPAYSPNSISEHTVLLILSLLRRMKEQQERLRAHNFQLTGLRARELRTLTVGVVGTGRIGTTTLQLLSGFGCRLLANDLRQNPAAAALAEYLPLPQLLAESDIVVLHCPLTQESHHLLGEDALMRMKPGALLVNTARGGLVDTGAVLAALDSGRLGGCAMDVYENEDATGHRDYGGGPLPDPLLERMLLRTDVIYTAHTAFYTDEAIAHIVNTTLQNLADYAETGVCANDVAAEG